MTTQDLYHQYDISYKHLFQHKELVASLLEDFIPPVYLDEFDWATLEPCPNAYTTPAFQERFNGRVWRIRKNNEEWTYLLIMLEFQSTVDQWMTLRILFYIALLWEGLIAADQLCNGKLPTILPLVLYNDKIKWTIPLDLKHLIILHTTIMSYLTEEKTTLMEELDKLKEKLLNQGRVEGHQEGRQDGIFAVAKNMLNMHMSIEQIIQATGLPQETIQKLATQM